MVKVCEICGSEFETLKGGNTRQYCFECSPSYEKGKSRAQTISALRKAMKKEAIKRLGGKCNRCGYDKCLGALNFHHKNPAEKEFGLSHSGINRAWNEYWQEAQKCEVLCANCHAEEHYNMED